MNVEGPHTWANIVNNTELVPGVNRAIREHYFSASDISPPVVSVGRGDGILYCSRIDFEHLVADVGVGEERDEFAERLVRGISGLEVPKLCARLVVPLTSCRGGMGWRSCDSHVRTIGMNCKHRHVGDLCVRDKMHKYARH